MSHRFLGYISTPNDPYMLGVATVRVYDKVVLRFKHAKTKDGKGDFFVAASYGIDQDGSKKYLPSFYLDSRSEDDELLEFVRTQVRNSITIRPDSVFSPQPSPQPNADEIGLPF